MENYVNIEDFSTEFMSLVCRYMFHHGISMLQLGFFMDVVFRNFFHFVGMCKTML